MLFDFASDFGDKNFCNASLGLWTSFQVFRWFKTFSEMKYHIEDKPHNERPTIIRTDENVSKIRDLMRFDHRFIIRMMEEHFNLPLLLRSS